MSPSPRAGAKPAVRETLSITGSITPMFATPVMVARVAEVDGLIAELRDIVRRRQTEDEGTQRSNVGGWHSSGDMMEWGGQPARTLCRAAIEVARTMSTFTDGPITDYDWRALMWANVSRPGQWNTLHTHEGSLWAAVFYLDVGGPDARGGELFFEDPRHPLPSMRLSTLRMTFEDGKPQERVTMISPKVGDLIVFPAWLRHGVQPFKGSHDRISIAMNIDVTDSSAAHTRHSREQNRKAALSGQT